MKGFPLNHEHRFQEFVLNTLLGGAMSSRLFQDIREERGLAYNVFSSVNSFRDTGYLMVYAATAPESAEQVVRLVLEEFVSLKESPRDRELKWPGSPEGEPHAQPGKQLLEDVQPGPTGGLFSAPLHPQ